MSKYLQSLKNKKRVKYHGGGHSYTYDPIKGWNFDPHDPNTSEHVRESMDDFTKETRDQQIEDLQQQVADMYSLPQEMTAITRPDADLSKAPINLDLGVVQNPSLANAKAGLAPDISEATDSPFVTKQEDIKQVETAAQPIETKELGVPEIKASEQAPTTVAETSEDLEASTMGASLAPDFTQAAADLMGVPKGQAATLLEKVPVQQPQTVSQAASGLTEGGVESGLSQTIATDPTAALEQIEGTDLESQTNIADLPQEALVTTQLNGLLAEMEEGKVPAWAKPAVAQVNAMMATRGLDASTLGRDALFTAIVQSAMPLAESNAQALQKRASEKLAAAVTFKSQEAEFEQQMALANLSNEQAAFVQERNFRQQTILSNQSASNAAAQFNATSQNQTDQFMASLKSNTDQFNAQSDNAMKQFNVTEQNKINALNAGNELQARQFEEQQRVDTLKFIEERNYARETWNAANAQAVEQSNVTWRRNANTAATAAYNAANQVNVQNAYNMTALQQTQLWQQLRDDATYVRTAWENLEQRKTALIQTAIGQESVMKNDTRGIESRDQVTKWLDSLGGS